MPSLLQTLNTRVQIAFSQAFPNLDYQSYEPLVVVATNPRFGDYQANIALPLAKALKAQPRAIAQTLLEHLQIEDICQAPEIAGPGFINLTLLPSYLEKTLLNINNDPNLGVESAQPPQKIVVDFSSPNIAKEMHVGHLRSTIIGDCLARVLEFRGHEVLRLNHVGDWGTQFGMLIAYLKEAYPQALTTANALDLGDLVTFYKKAKIRFDENADFKETARKQVVKLQSGEQESLLAWQLLCEQSRREFQKIYDILDIQLEERGESFYNPLLPEIITKLEEENLLEEDQGAKCVFLDGFTNKEGEPLPLIVQKSDGGYNYATTDLAALNYRIQKDEATRIIYVTDASQSNHFAQFLQVARKAGILPPEITVVHVPFGLVLGEDGKKLKTRSGDTIKLIDLLDEAVNYARQDIEKRLGDEERKESPEFIANVAQVVGIGAVKYADLSQNRNSNYVFSYDKMLSLQGNTAPYMLYAYARIQSISREGEIDFTALNTAEIQGILQEVTELDLAKYLLQLTDIIENVESELLPNRLCEYLYELSKKFNRFYEACPVLKSAEPLRTARIVLCHLTARTLKLGLFLLGIPVLERM
jgi:arginyl-tRNA synthetase